MKHLRDYTVVLLLGVMLLTACTKKNGTLINGTLIDAHTGALLDSATVTFSIKHDVTKYNSNNPYESKTVSVDASGHFSSADVYSGDDPISIFEIRKTGYLYHSTGNNSFNLNINQGEVNDVTVPLIPKDGMLQLNIENNPNNPDTVYVRIFSQQQLDEAGISGGKIWSKTLNVSDPNQLQFLIPLASGEEVKVYWSYTVIPYDRLADYPLFTSVPIEKNQTATLTITL